MDWPVVAGDFFVTAAAVILIAAPLSGMRPLRRIPAVGAIVWLIASLAFLSWSWRQIPGGITAACLGHLTLVISFAALSQLGRAAKSAFRDRLAAAMAALVAGVLVVAGIFALAPLTANASAPAGEWMLLMNPLAAVASAAGIDLLHLDTIYRTSPLAHRGVALPAWTTACVVYAIVGIAAHGVSRIPWSRQI